MGHQGPKEPTLGITSILRFTVSFRNCNKKPPQKRRKLNGRRFPSFRPIVRAIVFAHTTTFRASIWHLVSVHIPHLFVHCARRYKVPVQSALLFPKFFSHVITPFTSGY